MIDIWCIYTANLQEKWVGGAVRVVRVVTGQGGQVGQLVGMLGSSIQHNVLSENKRVYVSFSSSINENVR